MCKKTCLQLSEHRPSLFPTEPSTATFNVSTQTTIKSQYRPHVISSTLSYSSAVMSTAGLINSEVEDISRTIFLPESSPRSLPLPIMIIFLRHVLGYWYKVVQIKINNLNKHNEIIERLPVVGLRQPMQISEYLTYTVHRRFKQAETEWNDSVTITTESRTDRATACLVWIYA